MIERDACGGSRSQDREGRKLCFLVALDFIRSSRKNHNMRSRTFILAAVILAFAFFIRASISGEILRVSDGAVISYDRMIREISHADIIFVGEVHDEQAHHDLELRMIDVQLNRICPFPWAWRCSGPTVNRT